MWLIQDRDLANYLENDSVLDFLGKNAEPGDDGLVCQQWLLSSPPKRAIYSQLYGDLLGAPVESKRSILDVGGGLTSFTRALAERHTYHLVDVMAHDEPETVQNFLSLLPRNTQRGTDWWIWEPSQNYDIVIANDLFPNVDQRLGAFIKKFLPIAGEIRLSLTFYPNHRHYYVKRVDADEQMTLLAYDHRHLCVVMKEFQSRLVGDRSLSDLLERMDWHSCFPNGRQVLCIKLVGDRA